MSVTVLFSNKGGSGKTTSAVALSAEFARRGRRVLLWDLDPQASASMWIGQRRGPEDNTPLEVLARRIPVTEAATASVIDGVDLLAAGSALEVVEAHLREEVSPQTAVEEALEDVNQWDEVVLDLSPARNILSVMSLTAADHVLVTMAPEALHLMALPATLEFIDKVQARLNHDLSRVGTILTQYDARRSMSGEVWETLTERGERDGTWVERVPASVKVAEAPLAHLALDVYAPHSPPVLAYRQIVERLLHDQPQAEVS